MARTYSEFVSLVRDWSNKDSEALSDAIIKDALKYAADKAYRTLRISALEATVTYSATALRAATIQGNGLVPSKTELSIPSDLIEFIQVREMDSSERTTRIFNEKSDLRTFNDIYGEKYSDIAYWTRQGNTLIFSPGFEDAATAGNPDKVEIHYYRRLPALDAKYDVTVANYNAGYLETTTEALSSGSLFIVSSGDDAGAYATQADVPAGASATETFYIGKEVSHWLRDNNERILLMGSLAECFSYLQDDNQAQKYGAFFMQEIKELNDEDAKRNASGGNLQIHFNGRGLI